MRSRNSFRSRKPALRIIFSYDLFGAFAPFPTSYGRLPGARALEDHVNQLRDEVATARWIDGGDFSAGGVLAPASPAHELAWTAVSALSIDAAVPGNHEFDNGDDVFYRQASHLPFPLTAVDVPGHDDPLIIEAPYGPTVAVLGVTFYERRGRHCGAVATDYTTAAERITESAQQLRQEVDYVVVAMHEGAADYAETITDDAAALFCASVSDDVDAVFGAHTFTRHNRTLGGIPYLQPWPLGAEVAVLDIDDDGLQPWLSRVPGHRSWDGPGNEVMDRFEADIVGHSPINFTTPRQPGTASLPDAWTEGLRLAAGTDVALAWGGLTDYTQPRIDGLGGYLPAGPVSRAQLVRTFPWTARAPGQLPGWVADLSRDQIALLAGALRQHGIPALALRRFDPPHIAYREAGQPSGSTLLTDPADVDVAHRTFGDQVEWSPVELTPPADVTGWLTRARQLSSLEVPR